MKLYSFNHSTGELGYVEYSHTSRGVFTYLADALIAFAPLAGGISTTIFFGTLLLPESVINFLWAELSVILKTANPLNYSFWTSTYDLYHYILTNMEFGLKECLWLFLVISISHGAAPSSTDLRLATPGILMVAAAFSVLASLFPSRLLEIEFAAIEYFTLLLSTIITLAIPTALLLAFVFLASKILDLVDLFRPKPESNVT